jgi:hypothetical protein
MMNPVNGGLFNQFGRVCPVCGVNLGEPVTFNQRAGRFETPPCIRLEIGPDDGQGNYTWRVSAIGPAGANFRPAVSQVPTFVSAEVEYRYLLCGDGHIFPESDPVNHVNVRLADTRQRVDRWNMVAAVGAPASGKTYVLVRMMNQDLDNPFNHSRRTNQARVLRHQLNPLEQVPLDQRSEEYHKTVLEHRPIKPTQGEDTRPALILESIVPDAVEAIRELIRMTVVDGERRAEQWGKGFRQPLVVRTSSDDLLTWTGIADLPGELFGPGRGHVGERNKLRAYDALIWVLDPAVAKGALDPLVEDSLSQSADYDTILDGSLRPGTTGNDRTLRRAERERLQLDIGKSLAMVGNNYAVNQGRPLEMLITITKCDLFHAALRRGKLLTDLGRRDVVRRGVASYFTAISNRWLAGTLSTDEQAARVMEYLQSAASADASVHDGRIGQVANGLLRHYSDDEAFWGLIHEGTADLVKIEGDGSMRQYTQHIEVPSIEDHIDRSTLRGSGETLMMRDLIMSAIGCGIAYGLGLHQAVSNILKNEWQRIRLFLCSPLATVPVTRAAGVPGLSADFRFDPLEPDLPFPQIDDQSAAMTQLLLAVLRKARA